jgi:hypothetical protein
VSRQHRWRRGDGTVLSCPDLDEAVPMMLDELDDIKCLINQLEEWLLFDDVAADLFTDWLIAVNCDPGPEPSAKAVIDQLGTVGVTLHHILRAGIPNTGHRHPPTQ